MTQVKVKWSGKNDGPWIHIDSVIEYLATTKDDLVDRLSPSEVSFAQPIVNLLEALAQNYRNVKAEATTNRLDALAASVAVTALTNDLLSLRDELDQGPDHD